MSFWDEVTHFMRRAAGLLILLGIVTASAVPLRSTDSKVRQFTRNLEFDFGQWTMNAVMGEFGQTSLGASVYLTDENQAQWVRDYLHLVDQIHAAQSDLADIYSDPSIADPQAAAGPKLAELDALQARQGQIEPLAESILQEQVAVVLDQMGLGETGSPFPPVAFRFSTLPKALIVSPRNEIRQEANIELMPNISVAQQVTVENNVERALDVSALVVPVGGIGTYPTMVQDSTSLSWVLEVVAHEWTHNYLDIRPLGLNYDTSQDLRTMNETTATLMGKEVSRRAMAEFYPDLVPSPAPASPPPANSAPQPPPAFDFQKEMRVTRVHVDDLLAQGKIDEAESYMEARRLVFWDHGYHIRKLNQAYFAFYGSYADQPGGAAGDDPVGAAVRTLWAGADSPAAFLRTMAWLTSFDQLKARLGAISTNR
jgi:hypothetical protein